MKFKSFLISCLCIAASLLNADDDFFSGDGTAQDPYQITTRADLDEMARRSQNHTPFSEIYFKLMNDIDMQAGISAADSNFGMIYEFEGIFDGNGKVIRNLYAVYPTTENVGLFSSLRNNGQIFNLGLNNPTIVGASKVGALVGWVDNNNHGLTSCYVIGGSVQGHEVVGGLIGHAKHPISNCYSGSAVSGEDTVGGLIGWAESSVSNCYSYCRVTATTSADGLIGDKSGDVYNCYFDKTLNNCYSTSATGLSTAELKSIEFVARINNGRKIWYYATSDTMNNGYPLLYWEGMGALPTIYKDGVAINVTTDSFGLTQDFFAKKTKITATYADPFATNPKKATKKVSVKVKKDKVNRTNATLTLRGKVQLLNRKALKSYQKANPNSFTADILELYPEIQISPLPVTVAASNKTETGTQNITLLAYPPQINNMYYHTSDDKYNYFEGVVAYADSTKATAQMEYINDAGKVVRKKIKILTGKALDKLITAESDIVAPQTEMGDNEQMFMLRIPRSLMEKQDAGNPKCDIIIDNKNGIVTATCRRYDA